MVVNLIEEKQIFSVTLPEKIKGQYWVTDLDNNGKIRNLISIEAIKGEWIVKSNKNALIVGPDGKFQTSTVLTPLSFINLKVKNSEERFLIFSEPVEQNRQTFEKIIVKKSCELFIGRLDNNNICFENRFVSSNHAVLIYDNGAWAVRDNNSTNGTFINDYRVTSQPISYGDIIYIMGLKIVVGKDFFAINNPDNSVKIKSSALSGFESQKILDTEEKDSETEENYFYRSPRFKRQIENAVIKIDPPPAIQKQETVPMALLIGPSMTMGITSLGTGVLSVVNVISNHGDMMQAVPTLMMSFSMLLGSVMWPILTKKHEKKVRIKNEKLRQQKYLAYLDSVRDNIKRKCKEQSDILNENLITNTECAERIENVKRNLWERVIGQDDFLRLRVGIGDLPLNATISYPEKKFTMEDDTLENALYSLGDEPKELLSVPVSISLIDNYVTGMIGDRIKEIELAKSMILQMIALHSYDELKLILIADQEEIEQWDYIKWIPHLWNDEKTFRYLATTFDEVKELSMYLEKNLIPRCVKATAEQPEYTTYYVVISASKELADKCEAFNQLIKVKTNCGFSIVTIYDEIKNIPKETTNVIEVNDNQSKIFDKDDLSGKSIKFTAEYASMIDLDKISYDIANIQMDLSSQRFALPNMITFLEMFNVGKIEHLNSLTRWKENNPTISLQTPIGVNTMGETFYLDLHEKFHGPHGLVAGMTGSGKSEFIITYILSLAVNYHPDEVAFILIDYKGGGLTGAFENPDRGIKLPHLAGTITNLDGAAVKRSLISIQSELRRRQAIFNEARKIANEGTMDIYKYQQLYRQHIVQEPVPHLFIISDEFAELKTQQPEFMEQLISAARIGRSLGVHLILATQKPSGVVDDQIWSNSKFRVCLKVQEKADSNDMIKCPDAAELSNTGRFYLQVGFNEFFALGQSAWCGAEYVPTEIVEKSKDNGLIVVDHLGRVIKSVKPDKKTDHKKSKEKQIVAIVEYLSGLAAEENIAVRPLWLDPIPEYIYIDELEKKYNHKTVKTVLNPVIGEYDDPFNQCQKLLTLPISEEGNCVVYGSTGYGKTTFLTSLIYSMIKNHGTDELNIYILDFGSETLRAFVKAPQVGGVMFSYEEEKINNLFKMLTQELDNRKQLFAEFGGDYTSYCKNSGKIVPNIVVLINNYAGFNEQYEELNDLFAVITRDGIKYGIKFVLSASNTNAVRYKILQNFKILLTMQLNDPTEYSLVVGGTDGLLPSKFKGRGLIKLDKPYEFQTAYCSNSKDQFEFVRTFCSNLRKGATEFAKKVPILPKHVTYEEVEQYIRTVNKVPVGIDTQSLMPVMLNLGNSFITPIVAQDGGILENFIVCYAQIISNLVQSLTILDPEKMFMDRDRKNAKYMTAGYENYIAELFEEIVTRNNTYKDSGMDSDVLRDYEEKVVIICGFNKLHDQLSSDGKEKLSLILEKGEAIYKIHIIIVESARQLNYYSMDEWFKKYIGDSDGIYIGDGFADQYILKVSKLSNDYYEEIGDEFGYIVSRGKPVRMKVLTDLSTQMEADVHE